jgi:elongation factor Ts
MTDISADKVKSLRQRTGAGIMDCRNALAEVGGDEEKAVELIQKKGLAKAAKKAGAIAADGVIHAYIHAGSRLGVLVEVNCQTHATRTSRSSRRPSVCRSPR